MVPDGRAPTAPRGNCADPLHRLGRCRALSALLHRSSFLNIRVKDIEAVYAEWSVRGAQFLTPPKQHQYQKRCYIRDPDGHLIEVGQTTDPQGDWPPAHWPSSTPAEASE